MSIYPQSLRTSVIREHQPCALGCGRATLALVCPVCRRAVDRDKALNRPTREAALTQLQHAKAFLKTSTTPEISGLVQRECMVECSRHLEAAYRILELNGRERLGRAPRR